MVIQIRVRHPAAINICSSVDVLDRHYPRLPKDYPLVAVRESDEETVNAIGIDTSRPHFIRNPLPFVLEDDATLRA